MGGLVMQHLGSTFVAAELSNHCPSKINEISQGIPNNFFGLLFVQKLEKYIPQINWS
jgi:hypothetical protein